MEVEQAPRHLPAEKIRLIIRRARMIVDKYGILDEATCIAFFLKAQREIEILVVHEHIFIKTAEFFKNVSANDLAHATDSTCGAVVLWGVDT